MNQRIAVIGAALLAVASIAGCSEWNDERGRGDAPSDQQPDREVKVWPNADQFPNIAVFCVGGNGVYTTTRDAPPAVVADDPECAENGVINSTS